MPRISVLVAAGAAIFAVGLVVLFPARVAYHWFAPDGVQMSGIAGTVWSGTAAECRAGDLYLANLTWEFRPLALFTGKAGFAISADPAAGFVEGVVALSPGGTVHVSDLRARLPIAALEGLGALGEVDGMLEVDLESLVLDDGLPVRGLGTIEVANLVARQLSRTPLGNYRARISTVEGVVRADVEDVSGMLDLAGTIELREDRSYLLAGQVAPTASAPATVVQQLSYLGSPDANGMRSFRVEGELL